VWSALGAFAAWLVDVTDRTEVAEPGLQADQRLLDRAWLRIGAGLAVAGQTMVFSLAVNLSPPDGTTYWIVHAGLILSAAAVLAFLGGDLIRSALDAVRQWRINIDLLFLITLAGAFAGSLIATFTHRGAVYYEVVAILIVVHTAGKMLGARSRIAALRAVDQTRERFDSCIVRRADGSLITRSVHELSAADLVIVSPGGPITVDGEIVAGRGYVQETSMTGEWRPASHGPGDSVFAGTYSIDGSFEIRPGVGPRRLDGVLAAVAGARIAPSRLQQQADRLVAWFLPFVVVVSAATFVVWMLRAPWDRALFNAMAVLLVACPCAAGLATPVAVWGGLARLASFGVVARTGDFLDALARCDVVCLDKTGTLSTDAPAVRDWRFEPEFRGRARWLELAVAAAEEGLAHPIATALCNVIRDKSLRVVERRIEPGLGVVALVEDEAGRPVEIRVGEWSLGETHRAIRAGLPDAVVGTRPTTVADAMAGRVGAQQRTADKSDPCPDITGKAVFVFVAGAHAATIELQETWREGVDAALQELKVLGVEVAILTGDASSPAAQFPGVLLRPGMTPADKHDYVEELVSSGRSVLFVGDGVNDAAAMSAAQSSIAMQAGADLAHAAAMAVFTGSDLRFLPRAIAVARAARRNIRVNLRFAAAYNITGMAFAAAGVLHPVVAALLMVGSSAFVSVNALRTDGPGNRERSRLPIPVVPGPVDSGSST